MLDVVCDIAEEGDREHRRADDVFIMDKAAVLALVRVALGAEADDGGVLLIRHDADNAVRGDGVFIEHEGDDLPGLNGVRVRLFHIDQRTGVICRLHGAGEDREHLQAEDARSHKQQRQQHNERDQNGADDVPRFFYRAFHAAVRSLSSSVVRPARKRDAARRRFCAKVRSVVRS